MLSVSSSIFLLSALPFLFSLMDTLLVWVG